MKITMIGDRGCGKTTFMAGLYRDMNLNPYSDGPNFDLNIRLSDEDQREHVENIAQNLSDGVYPLATDFAQSYDFDFTVDGVKILDFTWYDYRGDALMGGPDCQESQQLFQEIDESDGLLVFIDSTTLDDPKWNKQSKYWRTIQQAVRNHASQADKRNPRSLGIVFTKSDDEARFNSPYPVKDNVDELLSSLPNSDCLYSILAYSSITQEKSVNAENVFLRVMTPFISQALQRQKYKIEEMNEMSDLLDEISANNSDGFLANLGRLLFGYGEEEVVDCANMLKSYPLYQSKSRKRLINDFLWNWKNRSRWDLFGNSEETVKANKLFGKIIDIWVDYSDDIDTLFGKWHKKIKKYLKKHDGLEKGGYQLF